MAEIVTETELLEAEKVKFTGPKHIERKTAKGGRVYYTVWYVNGKAVSHHEYKAHHENQKKLGQTNVPSPTLVGNEFDDFEERLKHITPEKIEASLGKSLGQVMNKKIEQRIHLKAAKLDELEYQALLKTFPPDFYTDRKQLEKLDKEMDRVLEKKYGSSDLNKIYGVDLKHSSEVSAEFVKSLRPSISKYFTEMCLKAAINRGYDPKVAMDTAYWLAFADLGYKSTVSQYASDKAQDKLQGEIGEPLGRLLGSASRNLPIAQLGYLAYSALLSPIATLRAVRDVTLGTQGKDVLPTRTPIGMMGNNRPNMFGYGSELGMFGLPAGKVKLPRKKPKQIVRERFTPMIMDMHSKGYPTRHIARAVTKESEQLGLPGISHQTVANIINGDTDEDILSGNTTSAIDDQGFNSNEYNESANYVNKRLTKELGTKYDANGTPIDFRNPNILNNLANSYINDPGISQQVSVYLPELPHPIPFRINELGMAVKRAIGLNEDKSKLQTFGELEAAKRQANQFVLAHQRIYNDILKSGRVTPDAAGLFANRNREGLHADLMHAMSTTNAVDADVWVHIDGQPVPISRAAVSKMLSMYPKIQALHSITNTLESYKHEMIHNAGMYGHTGLTTMELWPHFRHALTSSSPGQSTIEVRIPGVAHEVMFDRDEVRHALSLGDVNVREAMPATEQVTRVHGTVNGTLVDKQLINEQLIDYSLMLDKARKLKVKK